MKIIDTPAGYGIISRIFHWGMAIAIFALFGLGWWMVGLDYYSPYYISAPNLHRGVGVLLLMALLLRVTWRLVNVRPDDGDLGRTERRAARLAHKAFYVLLFGLTVSGYLISTTDGRPVNVFGWFSVPSIVQSKAVGETAGAVHAWLAYAVIGLALVHAGAAFKHQFVDKQKTLTRMWSGPA